MRGRGAMRGRGDGRARAPPRIPPDAARSSASGRSRGGECACRRRSVTAGSQHEKKAIRFSPRRGGRLEARRGEKRTGCARHPSARPRPRRGHRAPLTISDGRRSNAHYGTSPLTKRSQLACCIQHRRCTGAQQKGQQQKDEAKSSGRRKRRISFCAGVRTPPWTLPPPRTQMQNELQNERDAE